MIIWNWSLRLVLENLIVYSQFRFHKISSACLILLFSAHIKWGESKSASRFSPKLYYGRASCIIIFLEKCTSKFICDSVEKIFCRTKRWRTRILQSFCRSKILNIAFPGNVFRKRVQETFWLDRLSATCLTLKAQTCKLENKH